MSLEFLLIPRLICYQGLGDCVFWECQWSLLTRQNEPWEHVQWGGISVKSVTLGHQFFLQRFFFFRSDIACFLWYSYLFSLMLVNVSTLDKKKHHEGAESRVGNSYACDWAPSMHHGTHDKCHQIHGTEVCADDWADFWSTSWALFQRSKWYWYSLH